jgi:hypothetical protein
MIFRNSFHFIFEKDETGRDIVILLMYFFLTRIFLIQEEGANVCLQYTVLMILNICTFRSWSFYEDSEKSLPVLFGFLIIFSE